MAASSKPLLTSASVASDSPADASVAALVGTTLVGTVLICTTLATAPARAQTPFPSRSVEVIVPYAAGGGVSNVARALAAAAGKATGQNWVVVNREGAGGVVGFTAIAKAKPDGYTIGFSPASPMTNSPFVIANMPFRNDEIQPVCQVFENVFAIVVAERSPFKTLPDLIAAARAHPGALTYGHAGKASIPHLAVGAIEVSGALKFNGIAYKGDAASLVDLMGGTLDFGAMAISSIAGKNVRALAVLSDQPNPGLPGVKPITDFGLRNVSPGLNGLYVAAGTPRPVVERIEAICRDAVGAEAFAQAIAPMGQVPRYLGMDAFKARIDATWRSHAELVPTLDIEKN